MTPPDPEKKDEGAKAPEGQKPADVAKPAEAPKVAEAAKEVAKASNAEARQDLGDEHAQGAVKPSEAEETGLDKLANSLPQNKWTEMYRQLALQVKEHPELNGSFTNAALVMLLWAAKYAHYMDMIPGVFVASLDKEENLKRRAITKKSRLYWLEYSTLSV